MFSYTLRALFFLAFLPALVACATPPEHMDMSRPGMGMVHLGDKMVEKGKYGAAMDFYSRALRSDPENRYAIMGLAKSLEKWGNKTEALDAYQDGIEQRPNDGELRRLYGKLLLKMDYAMQAKEQYEAALDIDDDDLKARASYGVSLDYLGEHKAAQAQYKRVLKASPSHLSAVNNLAYSYILTRKIDRAIEVLEPHLHDKKATPSLRQNLALAYGLAGMKADAMRVARMDLSKEKAKENMAYYHRRRAELSLDTKPYAEIGSYATKAMALAQIRKMSSRVARTKGSYKPVIIPEVSAPGGTPRFAVRMMGCSKPSDISRLCKVMLKAGLPCTAKGKGL